MLCSMLVENTVSNSLSLSTPTSSQSIIIALLSIHANFLSREYDFQKRVNVVVLYFPPYEEISVSEYVCCIYLQSVNLLYFSMEPVS